MTLDGYYNRPTSEIWWDMFLRANPKVDFTYDQVRIKDMVANDDGDPTRNTMGILAAIEGMGREGETEWLRWDRPLMENIFKNRTVYIPPSNYQTVEQVMNTFNNVFKFQLSPADYYDRNITVFDIPAVINVQMRETCPCFQGVLTLTIDNPRVNIGELVQNRDLSGLFYPTNQKTKGQGPFYVFERNFSFVSEILQNHFAYDDVISDETYLILVDLFPDEWVLSDTAVPFNLKGARTVYNGPVSASPVPVNLSYSHVFVLKLDDVLCRNFAGTLILHYNV